MKLDFDECLPKLVKFEIFNKFDINKEEDKRILRVVYDNLVEKEFKTGEKIISEGDVGDSFYILVSGRVKVFRNTPSRDLIALGNLDSDMHIFFGETALLGSEPRTATVIADSDCRTLVLSGKKFNAICEKEPVFGYRTLLCLSRRMNASIKKLNSDMATLYEALFREIEGDR